MLPNPSWEVDSHSVGQEITSILWNQKIHDRVHNILPLDPILSQFSHPHILFLQDPILTNSIEQIHYWEANSRSATQQIPRLYGARVHNILPLVPLLSQMNPDRIFSPSHPCLCPNSFFTSGFPTKFCTNFSSPPACHMSRPSQPPRSDYCLANLQCYVTPNCEEFLYTPSHIFAVSFISEDRVLS